MRRIFIPAFFMLVLLIWSCAPTVTNLPPNTPSNPNPVDNATGVSIDVTLSWSCSDPDGDSLTYDIYFGTSSSLSLVKSDHTSNTYDPGTLQYSTTYYWKIVAKDGKGGVTEGPVWRFTTGEQPNNPPNTPSDPNPADNATDVPIDVTLSWTCSDPDGDTLTYDIYFGTTSNPPLVKSNHTSTTYNPGTLSYNTTYYWKIVAKDGKGGTTEGPIWRFTTTGVPNNPPDQPSDPYPTNGSSGVPVSVTLSWVCTDPDGDTLTYDIYFGTTSPPPLVRSDHTSTSYNPGTLDYGTTYYWKIVAKDGRGGVTEGPVWSFTTENVYGYLSIEKIWQLTDSSTGDNTGPIYSSPAISPDGWVYVGGQTNLYKISLSSGYSLLSSPSSPIWSSPAIDYYLEMLYVGNNNGELIIYDLYSNSLWDRIGVSPYAIYAAPLVVDDYVYVIDVNGYLYCLNLWGTLLWERSVASNIVWSSPVTDGVYLYFGDSQGVVYAVSLSDGSVMWSYSTNDEFVGGMAIDTNGNLYIAGEKLWSFTSSGYLRWSISLDSQAYANPVISRNGVIYIGTIGGTLYAIDSTDGSIIWTSDLGGSILSSCVIGDNEVIYVVSGTYLYAIKPYDGSVMDWIELENFVESNPVLHGGYIYVADERGYLYIISTLSYTISEPGESWPMFQRDWYHTGRR